MRPTIITLALLTTLTSTATARACTKGLSYCGYNLLKIGNYRSEIEQELRNKNINSDENHVQNSVFGCGGDGWIGWNNFCATGCRDGGTGNSDHC